MGFEPTSTRIRSTPAVGPKFGPAEAVTAGVDIRESPSTERAHNRYLQRASLGKILNGGPGGIRTHDSRIKSPELYR